MITMVRMWGTILTIWIYAVLVESYIVNPGPKYVATKGAIWPQPQNQEVSDDYFILTPRTFKFVIAPNGGDCNLLQNALQRYFTILQENTIPRINRNVHTNNKRAVTITVPEEEAADEGTFLGVLTELVVDLEGTCNDNEYPVLNMDEKYTLNVTVNYVQLQSSSIWGILRGLETFSQLVYSDDAGVTVRVNQTNILDYPRFPHRGLLLDTARHYIPVEEIHQVIDGLAYNKMNVLHWHIVDDQSFPFVSRKFPELSAQGAYDPYLFIYTPDDVQEIIEYSRQRGIRVMPEFDTPGHTRSWGVSHPELLTNCTPVQEGALGPLDPSKDGTYSFLKDLFTEVRDVFKDNFMHLGGDEVDFDCWGNDTNIVKFMNEHNISDFADLEGYYIKKVIDIADDLKFSSIVWEEVFKNGVDLPETTIVHVWRDWNTTYWNDTMYNITSAGKPALLSACWYLDQFNLYGTWLNFYKCEPTDFGGTPEQVELLLGGEACMWAESVNEYNVIQRIWPRASAPAEKLWSPYVNVTSDDFDFDGTARRLEEHVCRMNRRGLRAQPPTASGFCL